MLHNKGRCSLCLLSKSSAAIWLYKISQIQESITSCPPQDGKEQPPFETRLTQVQSDTDLLHSVLMPSWWIHAIWSIHFLHTDLSNVQNGSSGLAVIKMKDKGPKTIQSASTYRIVFQRARSNALDPWCRPIAHRQWMGDCCVFKYLIYLIAWHVRAQTMSHSSQKMSFYFLSFQAHSLWSCRPSLCAQCVWGESNNKVS